MRTEDDAVRAAVVAAGEGPESLLPGCVPDGELHPLALHLDVLYPEVHACSACHRPWIGDPSI